MSIFLYEKGDKVVINCSPPEDENGLWPDEFNKFIGYTGVISSVYDRSEENPEYDTLQVKFDWCGTAYEYLFYACSLKQYNGNLTTGSYVRVTRKHRPEDGEMRWADEMTGLIGSYGKVVDVKKRDGERNYIYKVQIELQGKIYLYWYYIYSLIDCVEENIEDKSKKWMLSEEGTIVFKVVRAQVEGGFTLIDKIGRSFDSTKLRVKDAPKECKGFDYVKDQPDFFKQ